MESKNCPVCHSADIELFEEEGLTFIRCKKCKYDESYDYDESEIVDVVLGKDLVTPEPKKQF